MERLEEVAWAAASVLPACIVLAPLLLALFEQSLSEGDRKEEGTETEGSRGE